MNASRSDRVALAGRVYRAVLRLCPSEFRAHYEADMCVTFDALVRDAVAKGRGRTALLLAREVWDVASTACAARARRPRSRPVERRTSVGAVLQDVRYALRLLRRQPGFAAVAIVTLALGIGANTAVFTVVNGVLLRPLPYGDPDRLVMLMNGRPGHLSPWFSPLNYLDFTGQSGAFTEAAALSPTTANLTGDGEPERLDGAAVTWNFFSTLKVQMPRGRAFNAGDAAGTDASTIVMSDALWKRRYGGRADLVGSIVRMDGKPLTVIGIAPPDFRLPSGAQFWHPLIFTPRDLAPAGRGAQWITVFARLKPTVSVARANTALATLGERFAAAYPLTNKDRTAATVPLQQQMTRTVRPMLLILLGAVGLVLLVACVNVANLLLARAQGRVREVAVRSALGAGRRRLVQQFLSESLVLGVAGGAGGLIVAFWCTRGLVALAPAGVPRLWEIGIDLRVLAFTMAIAVATSVLFGLAPALATTGGSTARAINAAGRGAIGAGSTRTRKALVVCEMALAVMLLVGAGLLIRSYQHLQQVNPGFDPEHVVTFSLSLPGAKYGSPEEIGTFVSTLVAHLESQPGVESAAAVFGLPFADDFSAVTSFTRRGEADTADSPNAGMRIVTPDYFKTMRIPLKAGRLFDARDDGRAPEVVVVNEQAARRFWPGQNPIGQQLHLGVRLVRGVRSGQKTIVGIVGDVKYGGLDAGTPPEIYLPHAQHQVDGLTIAVRTAGDPMAFAPAARREVASLDRELPVADLRPMTTIVGSSIADRRFTMLLLAAFAAIAMALAAIGIYGVLAYVVSQRTQEIGVRLAIGAAPGEVVRLFVREGARLALSGVASGLLAAFLFTRVLASLLFGVTATDPVTFAAVAVGLGAVALVATYLPARRAASVDPARALRAD